MFVDNANIYLDIETIPAQRPDIVAHIGGSLKGDLEQKLSEVRAPSNYKDETKIAEYIANERSKLIEGHASSVDAAYRKTSLDGAFGQVAVVSFAVGDAPPRAIYRRDWQAADAEADVLRQVNDALKQACGHHTGQRLIGHNIVRFDRKFMRQRGVVNGILMHPLLTRETKPWDSSLAYDTMTAWTGDLREFVSMSKLCVALGIPDKGSELDEDIDGSKVWDFVRRGDIDKVATYCSHDVIRTRAIYKRLNHLVDTPQLVDELDTLPF